MGKHRKPDHGTVSKSALERARKKIDSHVYTDADAEKLKQAIRDNEDFPPKSGDLK
jgi:hypothetical protein